MAGMIGESLFICGGRDTDEFSSACYKLIPNRWKQMPSLKEKRAYGTSSVFSNGSLWITGGFKSYGAHMSSSEVLDLGSRTWRSGPNLPIANSWHCVVQMNSTHTFFAGGYSTNGSNKHAFFYYDNKFERLPSMILARSHHMCASYQDYIIVAGGWNPSTEYLDSVEIFLIKHRKWISGMAEGRGY